VTYAALLIQKYRSKGIIVDTNLLLLLAVGLFDPNRIATFKRTNKFNVAIFETVAKVVEQFEQRYTTPYLVAELDNISRMLPMHEWLGISRIMQTLVPSLIEIHSGSSSVISHALHSEVGIADCSIAMVPDTLIFTDDLPFASRLQGMGRDVLNIGHLLVDIP
jgi:rRNA-processing protein FCF1